MKFPHIVFDLDGTIVESLPGIAQGLNAALAELGKPLITLAQLRLFIGEGARKLCAQALGYAHEDDAPAAEVETLLDVFRREYRESWKADGTRSFPGIPSMLMKLSASGAHMAVLSNKPHDATTAIVETLFRGMPLSPVLGYQDGTFPRKPDPAALHYIADQWGVPTSELILVGDSTHDAKCAENAGCHLALVPWGYARLADLLTLRREKGIPILGTSESLVQYLCTGLTRIQSR